MTSSRGVKSYPKILASYQAIPPETVATYSPIESQVSAPFVIFKVRSAQQCYSKAEIEFILFSSRRPRASGRLWISVLSYTGDAKGSEIIVETNGIL
jgi:hypothetical protein